MNRRKKKARDKFRQKTVAKYMVVWIIGIV
jgi:hypothetical protein